MSKNFFEIKNADFKVGNSVKVKNVSFNIEKKGDIICLLGPSGIGKTTILRSIAGLEKINKGIIKIKTRIISSSKINIEPEDRNISLAFQENSLFPHYNIERNIYFGTERKNKNKKIDPKKIIKLLNIGNLLSKYPHQISAGEAQRVSLARSVVSNPDLLLLDEPLSNIDENFKEEIQIKLKQILKQHRITTIIVTHDSNEAFYLASKNQSKKVLEITFEKLVSIDFNHNSASAIVDSSLTNVVGKNMGKISAWYDNEWGF